MGEKELIHFSFTLVKEETNKSGLVDMVATRSICADSKNLTTLRKMYISS